MSVWACRAVAGMRKALGRLAPNGTTSSDAPEAAGGTVLRPVRSSARIMIETAAVGKPRYTQTLPRMPESAQAARRLVSLALHLWGLGEVEDAALVVTELMSNAVKHARRKSVRVTVTRLDQFLVQVAVVDLSRQLPQPRPADADADCGRGLAIVAALTNGQWGVQPMPWGKRVWADLPAMKEAPGA